MKDVGNTVMLTLRSRPSVNSNPICDRLLHHTFVSITDQHRLFSQESTVFLLRPVQMRTVSTMENESTCPC